MPVSYAILYGTFSQTSLTYNNTIVHRVVPDFVIQMGDVTDGDGTGGEFRGNHFNDFAPLCFLSLKLRNHLL